MNDTLIAFLMGLPIGAFFLWVFQAIMTPTLDEFGQQIKRWVISRFNKNEYEAYIGYTKLQKLITELHNKVSYHAFFETKIFLSDENILLEVKSKNKKQLKEIAKAWINNSRIYSYATNDVFFAGMELLMNCLDNEDLQNIYDKFVDNDQAISMWVFFENVENKNPHILNNVILNYLRSKQEEWNKKKDE